MAARHKLNGSLIRAALVDELLIYLAPKLICEGRGMTHFGPLADLAQPVEFEFPSIDRRNRALVAGPNPRTRPVQGTFVVEPPRGAKKPHSGADDILCENGSMCTGIITAVGRLVAAHDRASPVAAGVPFAASQHGKRITVEPAAGNLDDVGLGDSIALNGACMTVTGMLTPPTQPQKARA